MFTLDNFAAILKSLESTLRNEDLDQLVRYCNCSFSHSGDECNVFHALGSRSERGIVVDVGAFHPFMYSNSFVFHLLGWHCINIEANPDALAAFQRLRPTDTNVSCGVSVDGNPARYYQYPEAARNSMHPLQNPELYPHLDPNKLAVSSIEIQTRTLNDILAEHVHGRTIDYLTIDIEGLDYLVLQSLDFSRFAPLVIGAELEIEEWHNTEMQAFFESKGYQVYCQSGPNVLLKRKDIS